MSKNRGQAPQSARNHAASHTRVGFDYVHVAVDDHSRLAYAEVLPDEKGPTCAGFLTRAAEAMAAQGAPVKRVMTDRQCLRLPALPRLPKRPGTARCQTHTDQTPPPLAERQSRTLQPHPPRRLGLPPAIRFKPSKNRRPAAMAKLLQQPPATRQPWRQPTHQQVQPTY